MSFCSSTSSGGLLNSVTLNVSKRQIKYPQGQTGENTFMVQSPTQNLLTDRYVSLQNTGLNISIIFSRELENFWLSKNIATSKKRINLDDHNFCSNWRLRLCSLVKN